MLAGVLQPLADRGDPRHAEHDVPCWIALRMLWSASRCNVTLSCKPVLACTGPTCQRAALTSCGQLPHCKSTPCPQRVWFRPGPKAARAVFRPGGVWGLFGGFLGAASVWAEMHDDQTRVPETGDVFGPCARSPDCAPCLLSRCNVYRFASCQSKLRVATIRFVQVTKLRTDLLRWANKQSKQVTGAGQRERGRAEAAGRGRGGSSE